MIKNNEDEKMGRRKKLGARILTEHEATMILPTYSKLKDQIEDIRKENTNCNDLTLLENQTEWVQKTNNIGIMGARGTGKTSVLKTIAMYLEKENTGTAKKKNIILPMIIPENMSDSMNLMAAVLGLFKKEVDEIEEERTNLNLKCWQDEGSEVVKKYKNLVKKYCYIQQEFRQVIVGQYTTENDYVKKSSEIFNSDIDFINCFHDFISVLLSEKSRYDENSLIFLFIDDIDLSTQRCIDVVKTLLSYLSDSKIITFLSGDLDTFEEALTLDFIRQEDVMDRGILHTRILNGKENSKILERKKNLAYEYLKKVVPPVYRHNVKHWDLNNRGNYLIANDNLTSVQTNENSFSDLLTEVFVQHNCEGFFQYFDYSNIRDKNEIGKKQNLPEVYHLFDSTSRGLNNVYQSLLDTRDVLLRNDNDNAHFVAIRLFLETIVSSNSVYNEYRTLLLEEVIQFGNDFNNTIIRCNNFYNTIYKSESSISPKIRFQLFIFLDFSIRLLKQTDQVDNEYYECKVRALLDLVNFPEISGNTQKIEENKMVKFEFNNQDNITYKDGKLKNVILNVFFLNDFSYSLRVYQYVKKGYNSFSDALEKIDYIQNKKDIHKDTNNMLAILYWGYGTKDILDTNTVVNSINANWKFNKDEYHIIMNWISPNTQVNIMDSISLVSLMKRNGSVYKTNSDSNLKWKNIVDEMESGLVFKKLFLNFQNQVWGNKIFTYGKLNTFKSMENYFPNQVIEEKKRYEYIKKIDELKLWTMPKTEIVKTYIDLQIIKELSKIFLDYEFAVGYNNTIKSIIKFMQCRDGVSNTVASQVKAKLNKFQLFEKPNKWVTVEEFKQIIEIVGALARNDRVWYGKNEANMLLKDLNSLPFILINQNNYKLGENEIKDIIPWIYCYSSYRIFEMGEDLIYKQGNILSDFSKTLFMAQEHLLKIEEVEFLQKLSENASDELNLGDFEDLFVM